MSDIAIKFENISKQYRLGKIGTGTISHDLNRWWTVNVRGKEDPYLKIGSVNDRDTKAESEYVWALRDINLEVRQGEVLGIIGKNGAGKSTLLKLLSRVTMPTTGVIKARGRIASLLEVGTGFHPEMTGRENIFMNGSIMGMTKAEITRKFDEIVDFAGVVKYIDTPVKRYSSGMTVRLGFAIAAHLEPEILVVDEVLAVGDAEFQRKAVGKMQDVSKGEGRTVLFVSHNMASILNLCQTCILLNSGMVETRGESSEVIDQYLMKNSFNSANRAYGVFDLSDRKNPYGTNLIVKKVTLKNSKGVLTERFPIGEKMQILIKVENFHHYPGALIGVSFNSPEGQRLASLNTGMVKPRIIGERKANEQVLLEIPKILLTENKYFIDISIALPGAGRLDYVENQIEAEIVDANFYSEGYKVTKHYGFFCLEGEWSIS